ncbi:hypothetical protein F8388_015716 [Cannabis sativa]|uniref:RNase H type-1 domain-containing protein n=1 Tax=Cannabis sativa TaxID=3483 RepID=A0A7J6I7A8_CANSA|nr:hypothetical protein F8388_015716 [Cannabis sativa]KAF4403045.1 hypothetical protein G4B88_010497 [Cannabis sativa]
MCGYLITKRNVVRLTLFHKKVLPQPLCNFCGNNSESADQSLPSHEVSHSASHRHLRPSSHEIIQEDTPALYVDAALDPDRGVTGLGLVFKIGSQRIIDIAKIHKPGPSSPIFAKAQALFHGLSWWLSSQLMPNCIFSDCLNLVSKVNSNWKDNSALSSLVAQIRISFSSFPGVSFLHLPCQLNTTAHSLAKEAIKMREDDNEDSPMNNNYNLVIFMEYPVKVAFLKE